MHWQGTEAVQAEIPNPPQKMTAPLVESLQLKIKGVAPLVRLAGKIVLGTELQRLKRELGYEGEGGWQQFREEQKSGNRPRWTEFCIEQAGITERMASHYHHCGEAVRFRLRFSSKPDAKGLLWAMEFKPSELSEKERSSLVERIEKIGLTRGDTQTYLRKEYKAAELPKELEAGKRIPANPWPAESPDDDLEKLHRVRSVVAEESARRWMAGMVQLAGCLSHRNPSPPDMRQLALRLAQPPTKEVQAAISKFSLELIAELKGGRLP